MTTLTTHHAWYGCPDDPDLCEDPECTNPVHLPDRDVVWSAEDEDASWLEEDRRAERRADV